MPPKAPRNVCRRLRVARCVGPIDCPRFLAGLKSPKTKMSRAYARPFQIQQAAKYLLHTSSENRKEWLEALVNSRLYSSHVVLSKIIAAYKKFSARLEELLRRKMKRPALAAPVVIDEQGILHG